MIPCKDCIYCREWVKEGRAKPVKTAPQADWRCHLYPKPEKVSPNHLCGQGKLLFIDRREKKIRKLKEV